MSKKNSGFAADLAAGIDLTDAATAPRRSSIASNVLTGRSNRLADLASGAIVNRTHELVDPARCRMWAGHNRDYALLNEERCSDLIESIKAQARAHQTHFRQSSFIPVLCSKHLLLSALLSAQRLAHFDSAVGRPC